MTKDDLSSPELEGSAIPAIEAIPPYCDASDEMPLELESLTTLNNDEDVYIFGSDKDKVTENIANMMVTSEIFFLLSRSKLKISFIGISSLI